MYATLEAAKTALAAISGVVSCKIGFEASISPADFPAIRIVPMTVSPGKGYSARTIDTKIIFGAQTTNSEGLELVYSDLSDMESDIRGVLRTLQGRWIETITDEDRLDAYKLMAVRCELIEVPA